MEFHEKLQLLRKQRGLTQEELAERLFVSRTAVSKWESGRGFPSIDSLKAISGFFSVTIDALLSGEELLTIAQEDRKQAEERIRARVFGLLDCGSALLLLLPIFGQSSGGAVLSVSLIALTGVSPLLLAAFWAVTTVTVLWGIGELTLCEKHPPALSMALSTADVLLFILSRYPYPAVFSFALLCAKAFFLLKKP